MGAVPTSAAFVDELVRINRKMRNLFDDRARAQGLTLPRARLLLHLARNGAATQSELAGALEIEQPTMVKLVDGLEAKGLVRRCPVEGDRRAKRIELTDAAQAGANSILDFVAELREQVLEGVDEADLLAATRVLKRISRNMGVPA
ncbi:MAG: MarR family transcriptional regulator [Methylobacterium mesophilicum]|nr:MarR family transcriptional regulator [Methylobacterium mesophilicum]